MPTKPPSKEEVIRYASQAAREVGLPPSWELAIIGAESNFDPVVGAGTRKSSAGAVGYGQLMPGTARGLGVDPYNWRENITGSARYLKQQFDRFHSLPLAASAYNSGPGGTEGQGQVEQIPETKAYVAKVTALEHQYRNLGGAEPFQGIQTPDGHANTAPQPKFGLAPDPTYLSSLQQLGPLASRVAGQAAAFQPTTPPITQQGATAGTPDNPVAFQPQGKVSIALNADREGMSTKPAVKDFVAEIAGIYGKPLTIFTGTNHNQFVVNTHRQSDHWTGDAGDVGHFTGTQAKPDPRLTRLGQDALIAAGADPKWARKQKGGLFNIGDKQIIFNSLEGGNHYNHLHVSVRGS